MLPHGAGIPGGTVPFRYGEARGIFSFEKRMSPRPPKEKRGGISISPRTPMNAAPTDAGTQLFEEHLSAQPAGDFWILPAVRTGRSFVWVSWPMRGQLSPDTFSFPPCTAHFLFGVSKRKWGCIPAGKACIPAAVRRTYAHQPGAQFDPNKQMISISKQKEVFLWRN